MSNKLSSSKSYALKEHYERAQPNSKILKSKYILMALIPLAIAIASRTISNILVNIKYASRLVDTYGDSYSKYANIVGYSAGERILIIFLTSLIAYIAVNIYLKKTDLSYIKEKKFSLTNNNPDFSFLCLSLFLGLSSAFFVAGSTLLFDKSPDNIYTVSFSFKGIVKLSLLIFATYLGARYKELVYRKSLPVVAEVTNMPFLLFNIIQALLFAVIEMNFISFIPHFCVGYLFGEYFSVTKDYKKTMSMHIVYAFASLGTFILAFNFNLAAPYLLIAAGIAGLFSIVITFFFMLNGEVKDYGKEK